MRNFKMIMLTVIAVSAVLFIMLTAMTGMENIWDKEKTADNLITIDKEIISGDVAAFDYPYLQYSENKDKLSIYSNYFGESWSQWRTEEFIQQDNNMISYQTAANTAGEAIKYIYGISEQSQTAAALQLYRFSPSKTYIEENRYIYKFFDSQHNLYTVNIDPYKNMIFRISKDDLHSRQRGEACDVTDKETKELQDIFTQYLSLLNIDSDILSFNIIAALYTDGDKLYTVNSYLSNEHIAVVSFEKAADGYYELKTFVLLYSPDKTN